MEIPLAAEPHSDDGISELLSGQLRPRVGFFSFSNLIELVGIQYFKGRAGSMWIQYSHRTHPPVHHARCMNDTGGTPADTSAVTAVAETRDQG